MKPPILSYFHTMKGHRINRKKRHPSDEYMNMGSSEALHNVFGVEYWKKYSVRCVKDK